jgi:hypothetical protein
VNNYEQEVQAIAMATGQRQTLASQKAAQMIGLLQQNTQPADIVKGLSQRIELEIVEMHSKVEKT